MAALSPTTAVKRPYKGSIEDISGQPPADDQKTTAADENDHRTVLIDHKNHLDGIMSARHDFVSDFDLVINGGALPIPSSDETDFVADFDALYTGPGD